MVDRAEEQSKNLPEGANNDNSDERFLHEQYGDTSYNEIREYLKEELERLQESKKMYVSDIAEAKESKGENMEVDSLTGNKRKESSTEDTNSSKRQKPSNNDDSSGPSAPSGSSGPSAPSGSSGPSVPSGSSGPSAPSGPSEGSSSAPTNYSVGGDGGIPTSGSNYTDSSNDSENDSSNDNNNGGSKFYKINVLIFVLIFMLKGLSEVLDILFNNFL